MVTTELTYRLYEDKDLEGVLQLWEHYSGWGAITHQQFEDWYLKTPYGPCLVVVAENEEGEIVGQIVFFPSVIYINGREEKAIRASAPIVNPTCRHQSLNHADHPALALIKFGMETGSKKGYEIVYSFPAQGWATLLKAFPRYGLQQMHVALYDCFAISLQAVNVQAVEEMGAGLLQSNFSEEYDRLWDDAVWELPIRCAIKRNAKWLQWKIFQHAVIEIRSKASRVLVGFVAVNKKSGLIVDMLARTNADLSNVLQATVHYLQSLNDGSELSGLNKLTGMLSSVTQAALENIPYTKENFTFAFSSTPLQDESLFESLAPENWYMMPND